MNYEKHRKKYFKVYNKIRKLVPKIVNITLKKDHITLDGPGTKRVIHIFEDEIHTDHRIHTQHDTKLSLKLMKIVRKHKKDIKLIYEFEERIKNAQETI